MQKIDISVCRFGAGVILKHLNSFSNEIDRVRKGKDIEPIHQMRVASRRLHNALTIFSDCFNEKDVSFWQNHFDTIRRSLGAVRDLDVKMEILESIYPSLPEKNMATGFRRLILRLKQKRMKQKTQVTLALNDLLNKDALQQIRTVCNEMEFPQEDNIPFSSNLYHLAQKIIPSQLSRLLKYEQYVDHSECSEELHNLRIAAKRIRYSLEIFSPLYPDGLKQPFQAARTIQELLGNLHDCDIWIVFLPEFLEKERKLTSNFFGTDRYITRIIPGIQYFQQDRQVARENFYNDFVKLWYQWKEENLWDQLLKTIDKYVIPPILDRNPLKNL